jgi:hypothetical protein
MAQSAIRIALAGMIGEPMMPLPGTDVGDSAA